MSQMEKSQKIFLDNKPKNITLPAYIFLLNKVNTNKLVLYSELMIFIRYKDNNYCFMCYTQGNIIFCSKYAIFNEKFFPKYTNCCII